MIKGLRFRISSALIFVTCFQIIFNCSIINFYHRNNAMYLKPLSVYNLT